MKPLLAVTKQGGTRKTRSTTTAPGSIKAAGHDDIEQFALNNFRQQAITVMACRKQIGDRIGRNLTRNRPVRPANANSIDATWPY